MLSRLELRSEGGFMLVELLIAAIMISIVMGSFVALFVMVQSRTNTMQNQAVLVAQARPVLDTMAAQLQAAVCNGTTQPITAASGTQVTFTTPDRQQPYHLQQITYSLAGGVLSQQIAQSTNTNGPPWTMGAARAAPAVPSVTNAVVFDFISSSGTDLSPSGGTVGAANLPTIAKVTMTVVVTPSTSNGSGPLTVQSSASLRTPTCN
jgi:Tfp pilus assembly protein PilW